MNAAILIFCVILIALVILVIVAQIRRSRRIKALESIEKEPDEPAPYPDFRVGAEDELTLVVTGREVIAVAEYIRITIDRAPRVDDFQSFHSFTSKMVAAVRQKHQEKQRAHEGR